MSEAQNKRFSEFTWQLLKDAGWYPERDVLSSVEWPPEFTLFPVAADILKEFGHLTIGEIGPGITCARSIVYFEPNRAGGEDDRFAYYEEILGRKLCPLAEVDRGYFFLASDEQGMIFLLMDVLFFVDGNFDRALEKLLVGIMSPRVDEAPGKW